MRIEIDQEKAVELIQRNSKDFLRSNLGFLKQHKGFRPGMIHTLVGMTGGGKTTLRNTLIVDFISNNPGKNIFVWQSEESTDDLVTKLSRNKEVINSKNIYCCSEPDLAGGKSKDQMQEMFFEEPVNFNADLVLFDNITTSALYGHTPGQQSEFALKIKNHAKETNIPYLVMAHTSKNVGLNYNKLISTSDIRGSATITNLSEYSYNLQQFNIGNMVNTILICEKSRHHVKEKLFFQLAFDKDRQLYIGAIPLDFDEVKSMFRMKNSFEEKR